MDAEPPRGGEEGEKAPPQFSPDGRFWWDGTQWTPVERLPRPAQFEGSGGYQDEWHDEAQSARSLSKIGMLLIGVGAVVLAAWAVLQFGIIKLH
jgi:hypothetical protein